MADNILLEDGSSQLLLENGVDAFLLEQQPISFNNCLLLENGSDFYLLEDGSGCYVLEDADAVNPDLAIKLSRSLTRDISQDIDDGRS